MKLSPDRLRRFVFGFLAATVVVAACSPQPTASPKVDAPKPAAEQVTPEWQAVIDAAKKEGEVFWSGTSGAEWIDPIVAGFTAKYGIKVNTQIVGPPEFIARFQAELAAGKQSVDIRSGGSPLMRDMSVQGLTDSFGTLPAMSEPKSVWTENPFQDVEAGLAPGIFYAVSGYYLMAHNDTCPPDNCPKSYKDLADPKFRGKLYMNDPIPGGSPGTRWAAYTYLEYGEDYLKAVAENIKALSRNTVEAPKELARGEYAFYIHQSGPPVEVWKLPQPHPFRLVIPEDGQMVLLSGIILMKQAPHPNAAKLLMNYILSQEGQQIIANVPGATFMRKDVKAADPEVVKISDKLFPRNPDTFEFASTYAKYLQFIDPHLKARGLK